MTIEAKGQFTLRDYRRGVLLLSRTNFIIITILSLSCLALGIFLGIQSGWSDQVVIIVLSLVFLICPWVTVFYRTYRTWKLSHFGEAESLYQFSELGMICTGKYSQGEVKWGVFIKWKEDKHSFIIYTQPKFGTIIPKRFFLSSADVNSVREIFRTNVKGK